VRENKSKIRKLQKKFIYSHYISYNIYTKSVKLFLNIIEYSLDINKSTEMINILVLSSSAITVVRHARVFVLPCAIIFLFLFSINYSLTNTVNEPKCIILVIV
jgi:hypothetical protein